MSTENKTTAETIEAACNVDGFPSLTDFGKAVSLSGDHRGVSEHAEHDEEVALWYTFEDGSRLYVRTGDPDVVSAYPAIEGAAS